MIELRWRKPAPPIVTQWRGPSGMRAVSALAPLEMPLAALIGPPGNSGAPGPAGPQGLAGALGSLGPQGATGPAGLAGPQGVEGVAGPPGVQGLIGPVGAAGSAGPQGIQGATGPPGSQGVIGPVGLQGLTGPQGSVGPTGPTGETGPAGATGPQGTIGAQGSQGPQGIQGPQGVVGPPPLSGTAIITLPPARGAYELSQVVTANGVNPSHRTFLTLSPSGDDDENTPEMLDLVSLSGLTGTDEITVTICFAVPVSGPITLYWSAY